MTSAPNPPQRLSGSKWLILSLLLVLLVACGGGDDNGDRDSDNAATPTSANGFYTVELRVDVTQASVFARPSRAANVVYNLVEGDVVRAVGRSDPDELGTIFYAIDLGDSPGWIAETQVEPLGNTDPLIIIPLAAYDPAEVAADSDAPPTPGFGVVARPYTANAPIYAAPDETSEVVRIAGETETLEVVFVTNYTLETRYFGVRLERGFGWIDERDFLVSGDITTLSPVAVGVPTPTRSPATPIPTTDPAVIVTPTLTDTPRNTPTVAASDSTMAANVVPNTSVPATTRPSLTPTVTLTPASIQAIEPPPLSITLPTGWEGVHVNVPITSAFANDSLNLSLYEGPLISADRAYIWVLWQFDLLLDQTGELSLWPNALLYLRSVLFSGCNIGVYPDDRRSYPVGDRSGTGTIFSAVGCGPDAPDVAGWLVALPVGAENYLFYVGISPVENVLQARDEVQAILDTIRFDAP